MYTYFLPHITLYLDKGYLVFVRYSPSGVEVLTYDVRHERQKINENGFIAFAQ